MEFNEQFLREMGLEAMPPEKKQPFLAYIKEELEIRVGERISRAVSEAKMREFDLITDQNAAAEWLATNCPNYLDIVDQTIEEMKNEIRASRDQLVQPT